MNISKRENCRVTSPSPESEVVSKIAGIGSFCKYNFQRVSHYSEHQVLLEEKVDELGPRKRSKNETVIGRTQPQMLNVFLNKLISIYFNF